MGNKQPSCDPRELENQASSNFASQKKLSVTESTSSTLLAFCSLKGNQITIIDLKTKHEYAKFNGASMKTKYPSHWCHVKAIPGTRLLVSLNTSFYQTAILEIFDVSKKQQAIKLSSFISKDEVIGYGDIAFNPQRDVLATIPIGGISVGKTAYHLFKLDYNDYNKRTSLKLLRKSKWPSQYKAAGYISIPSLDISPDGVLMASIADSAACLISDLNTNNAIFQSPISFPSDATSRCRWSVNIGEPLLFIKCNRSQLTVLDTEKNVLTLKDPVNLGPGKITNNDWTYWIDVCPNNGNLLAVGGSDKFIKIYDRRESRIVKIFENVHSDRINCVRWNLAGDHLASASHDQTAKVTEFKTGKVIQEGITSNGSAVMSVCFL